MHGSRWRREETRPVGPARAAQPGASRRPYYTTDTTHHDMTSHSASHTEQQRLKLAREIAQIDAALPGSLVVRSTRCGKPTCRCKADPPQLHGPYIQWTRKINGTTHTRLLTPEQHARYHPGSRTPTDSANYSPNSNNSPSKPPTTPKAGRTNPPDEHLTGDRRTRDAVGDHAHLTMAPGEVMQFDPAPWHCSHDAQQHKLRGRDPGSYVAVIGVQILACGVELRSGCAVGDLSVGVEPQANQLNLGLAEREIFAAGIDLVQRRSYLLVVMLAAHFWIRAPTSSRLRETAAGCSDASAQQRLNLRPLPHVYTLAGGRVARRHEHARRRRGQGRGGY